MSTYTDNYKFVLQTGGENVGAWGLAGGLLGGGPGLNTGIFSPLDTILGGNYSISGMISGNYPISLANWNNGIFILSGTLTGPATVTLPLSSNSVGSATAVGGKFVVVNNTSGNFSVTVKTSAAGSTGVTIPQTPPSFSGAGVTWGVALYSDTVNVSYQNYGVEGFAKASNGPPNGFVAGVAAGPVTNASLAFDYVNSLLYVCTTTGDSSTAVWTNPVLSGQTQPIPEGYLTVSVASGSPIITGDVTGGAANTIYYAPFVGTWAAINSGSGILPYKFSQMQLNLSSSQTANQIYDIYLIYSGGTPGSGTPVIASGAAWTTVTPGGGNRGSGGGSAQIQRDASSGLWTNAVSMAMAYSNGSISGAASVPAGGGVYLGSIQVDGTNGQVSCYRTFGQNRKFGVWNAYNRVPINLIGGDSTAGPWVPPNSWRQSNGVAGNTISVFTGLPEEEIIISFSQFLNSGRPVATPSIIGIGVNSTSSPSGQVATMGVSASQMQANYIQRPFIGSNSINMLENGGTGGSGTAFYGTNNNMQMVCSYRG